MSDSAEFISSERAMGRLEGRVASLEADKQQTSTQMAAIHAKLDAIKTDLDTGKGGLRFGLWVAGFALTAIGWVAHTMWPFGKG